MTMPAESPAPNDSLTGLRDLHPSARPTWRFVLIAMGIILFGLLLQVKCMSTDYQKVIDDNQLIYNFDDRGCEDIPVDCFKHPVFQLYYRPLFTATFALQDRLFRGDLLHGRDTRWYHLENLTLHAAVCGLAFWFFLLLFKRERPALLAGLILALHPLQVSVTTFIGGRPDSMALFFLLLFSIGAMNSVQNPEAPTSGLRRLGWFLLSLFSYTCAIFTKEQCILMLLTLPLLLWHRIKPFPIGAMLPSMRQNRVKPLFKQEPASFSDSVESFLEEPYILPFSRQPLPWLLLNLLYLVPVGVYAVAAKRIIPFESVPKPHWPVPLHLEMIGRTLWYFERLLLVPTVGPIHQSTLGPWDVSQPAVMIAGYLLAALWLATLWRVRRNPALRFCALWTTLTLFPCLNLIPIPSQFASCYRGVIPLLGFAGLLGAVLDKLFVVWQNRVLPSERRPYGDYASPGESSPGWWQHRGQLRFGGLTWGILLALVAFYSWETVADVSTWQNNQTLMWAELYGDPNFSPSYGGLGFWDETIPDWRQAEKDFGTVIDRVLPQVKPGESLEKAIDSPASQRNLWSQSGLRYVPRTYLRMLLPHRGWARQQQGHFAAAAEDYRRVLLIDPNDNNSRANLYNSYMANGQVNEAVSLYSSAFQVPARSNPNEKQPTP